MKTTLLLVSFLLASCASGPSATVVAVDGSKVTLRTGGAVMAERDLVLAEVTGPGGLTLKYAAQKEDSTRVPIAAITAWVSRALAGIQAGVTNTKTLADRDIALGAQQAAIAEKEIAAGISGATIPNPNDGIVE